MIWVAGRSPTLASHNLRGVAMHFKATTLTYLAIEPSTARSTRGVDVQRSLNWGLPQVWRHTWPYGATAAVIFVQGGLIGWWYRLAIGRWEHYLGRCCFQGDGGKEPHCRCITQASSGERQKRPEQTIMIVAVIRHDQPTLRPDSDACFSSALADMAAGTKS